MLSFGIRPIPLFVALALTGAIAWIAPIHERNIHQETEFHQGITLLSRVQFP